MNTGNAVGDFWVCSPAGVLMNLLSKSKSLLYCISFEWLQSKVYWNEHELGMLFWATCKRRKALLDSKKIFASGSKIHCEYEASFFPFLCISATLKNLGSQ